MTDPGLAALIREVLSEELAKLKTGAGTSSVRKEAVSIGNDAELNAFVGNLVDRMKDPAARQEIESGRLEFTLSSAGQTSVTGHQPADLASHEHRIEKGFLSERQIDKLPDGLKRLVVGKAVRITPLARDRARHRGIVIERMEP